MWPRRTNCRRLSMEGMLLGHKVPTTALPEEQVLHSSSFQIFASCLYSVCMFAEHIHWTFFFHRLRRVLHWNESQRPSQSNMPHKARVISGTFLRCAHTCLQTFRGRMVTRAEATPATHHPHFHEGVSQKVLKSRFL